MIKQQSGDFLLCHEVLSCSGDCDIDISADSGDSVQSSWLYSQNAAAEDVSSKSMHRQNISVPDNLRNRILDGEVLEIRFRGRIGLASFDSARGAFDIECYRGKRLTYREFTYFCEEGLQQTSCHSCGFESYNLSDLLTAVLRK